MKIYYHPVYDILGILMSSGLIRVFVVKDTKTFIPKTDSWTEIGEI